MRKARIPERKSFSRTLGTSFHRRAELPCSTTSSEPTEQYIKDGFKKGAKFGTVSGQYSGKQRILFCNVATSDVAAQAKSGQIMTKLADQAMPIYLAVCNFALRSDLPEEAEAMTGNKYVSSR